MKRITAMVFLAIIMFGQAYSQNLKIVKTKDMKQAEEK
jgi:hypothetical protein